MTVVEKAAYLKGLTEGLGVEPESKEGKLWNALCDLVSDMAHEIEDLQATSLDYADVLDEMADELAFIEDLTCDLDSPDDEFDEDYFDDWEEDEDGVVRFNRSCCGRRYGDCELDEDEEEDDEELEYDGVLYDVTCPSCGEEITFDEDTLSKGSIPCPTCGEELEFDLDADEENGEE